MERKSLKKPSVSTAFNEYIADKEHTVVPSTLDAYIIAFQVFCSEVGVMGDEPVTVLSKNLVEQWKSVRLSSSSSMATSNQYLNAFRTFLYWCMSRDYLDNYTVKLFRNVKCMSLKRYPEEDIAILLERPKKSDRFSTWRTWLTINIIMATGARIMTVQNIRKSDITDTTITFAHTKNKKVLVLPLASSLKGAITIFNSVWDNDSEYLCPSQAGEMCSTDTMRESLENYCKERGVKYQGWHAFRHSYAYLLWKNGVDVFTIMQLLGHSSLEMTKIYLGELSGEELSKVNVPLDIFMHKKVRRK